MNIAAIDFDGTLFEHKYPKIGESITKNTELVKRLKAEGWKLILWSCRFGDLLDEAVETCKKYGIEFDVVNANLPEIILLYGDSRKVVADLYFDDKSIRAKNE